MRAWLIRRWLKIDDRNWSAIVREARYWQVPVREILFRAVASKAHRRIEFELSSQQ